jgi:hypothetical protein
MKEEPVLKNNDKGHSGQTHIIPLLRKKKLNGGGDDLTSKLIL